MKLELTFTERDFATFRDFEKAVKRQVGSNVYVGTDSVCVYFPFPKELASMLRPFPERVVLTHTLESELPDKK